MNRIIFVFFILLQISSACNKADDHEVQEDFKGTGRLRGRLSYYNPYSADATVKPLAGKPVKLAYHPSDTLNFLYDVITDKDGYFSFSRVDKEREYDLFFKDSINNINYAAFAKRKPDNDTINILATPELNRQNGFYLHVKDSNGDVVPGVNVCVFNSALSAGADTCLGSLFPAKIDIAGNLMQFNVMQGKYYFRIQTQIGSNTLKGLESVYVAATGITEKTMFLTTTPVNRNGIAFLVLDNKNTPVNNVALCIFNSQVLFDSDSCAGSSFQKNTDVYGKAGLYNIAPGTYFVRAKYQVGNTVLKGTDRVNVSGTVLPDILHME